MLWEEVEAGNDQAKKIEISNLIHSTKERYVVDWLKGQENFSSKNNFKA